MWKNRESLRKHHKRAQYALVFEILSSDNRKGLQLFPASLLYRLCKWISCEMTWTLTRDIRSHATFCFDFLETKLRLAAEWTNLAWECGQGVGSPWHTEPLPPGGVYRTEIWWDHSGETVPLLMRRRGRFSKNTHASLEVLVSSVGLWLHSQWFRPYLGLSFSSRGPGLYSGWRCNTFYF